MTGYLYTAIAGYASSGSDTVFLSIGASDPSLATASTGTISDKDFYSW